MASRLRALVLILLVTPLLAACVTNPSTGRSQLLLLPADQVTAMGQQAAPQMIAEFGGEAPSPELRGYVRRVGTDVAAHVETAYKQIQWEFYVLDSDVINAFALPGGKVFVTVGLLERFENEAQLAGVLGHEIGHVTARHVDERVSQALIAQYGLAALGQYTRSDLISMGADMATQVVLLGFSRSQESEADRQGLKYMTGAGYDPRGLRQVMDVFVKASGQARQPEMLSTHPDPRRRLRDIDRALATEYAQTQKSTAYGLYASRFEREALPYLRR